MAVTLIGVIPKRNGLGERVEVASDDWRALVARADKMFGASLRLEDHPAGPCSCPSSLVSILSPSVGHYAVIGTLPAQSAELTDTVFAYMDFIAPQLRILELRSNRRRRG